MQLVVTIPLPPLSLKELLSLQKGQQILSSWPAREDVPLFAGDTFVANVTFEPAGAHLGVRISGFHKRNAGLQPVLPAPTPAEKDIEMEAESDRDPVLSDIRLPASLCFGSKTMLLHQILDLTSGDAIVLERTINAPVSVMAGKRIVAQGSLIAVKGCYGVRLTKLAELSRRLAESKG